MQPRIKPELIDMYNKLSKEEKQQFQELFEMVAVQNPMPLSFAQMYAKLKHGLIYQTEDQEISLATKDGRLILHSTGRDHPFNRNDEATFETAVMTMLLMLGSFKDPQEPSKR